MPPLSPLTHEVRGGPRKSFANIALAKGLLIQQQLSMRCQWLLIFYSVFGILHAVGGDKMKQRFFTEITYFLLSEEGRHIYRPLDRKGQKRLLSRLIR